MTTITLDLQKARRTLARELFAQTATEPLTPEDHRVVWDKWMEDMRQYHPARGVVLRYLAEADALSEALEKIGQVTK